MIKLDFCPCCGIGINEREEAMGFCQNCKGNWDVGGDDEDYLDDSELGYELNDDED